MDLAQAWRGDIKREFNNIILVGLTGCGKTSIGRCLAQALGFGFLDLDRFIEEGVQKKIPTIFRDHGEVFFREQESEALQSLSNIVSHVIAVGSGAVEDDANWEAFEKLGIIIWLNCDISVIAKRLLQNPDLLKARPMLADISELSDEEKEKKLQARLETLLMRRKQRYESAKFILANSFLSEEDSARSLKFLVTNRQGKTAAELT